MYMCIRLPFETAVLLNEDYVLQYIELCLAIWESVEVCKIAGSGIFNDSSQLKKEVVTTVLVA